MNLMKSDIPKEVLDALRSGLGHFLSHDDPLSTILTRGIGGRRVPLEMFALDLHDVAAGNWKNTKPRGWRFLAVAANGDGIVVDVAAPGGGRPARVASVQRGPRAAKILDAVLRATDPANSPDNSAALKVTSLNVPGLLIEALWLMPKNGTDGWAVPFHTLIKQLESTRSYTLQDFIAKIQPLAQRRLDNGQNEGLSETASVTL
jgi:hypothetical protein